MKFLYSLAAVSALFAAAPLVAQSAGEAYAPVWHPSGKTPSAMYRPVAQKACAANRHHQAGKAMLPAIPDCAQRTARRDGSSGASEAAGR